MTENRSWTGNRSFRWSLGQSLDAHLSGTEARQFQEDLTLNVLRGINRLYPHVSNSNNASGSIHLSRHQDQNPFLPPQDQDVTIEIDGVSTSEPNLPSLIHTNQDQNGNTTNSELLIQTPEIRVLMSYVKQIVPFLLLLSAKLIYDHRLGLIVALSLLATFYFVNQTIKKLIAAKEKRQRMTILWIISVLVADIFLIYSVFRIEGLWYCLIFIPPLLAIKDLWTLIWVVGITDFVLKFVTFSSKAVIICLPAVLVPFKKRGKYYLFIEQCSQYYRCWVPVVPWLSFLLNVYSEGNKIFGTASLAIYIISKGKILWNQTMSFIDAIRKVTRSVSYGMYPSKDELISAGTSCPICQDNFCDPIKLHCKHIFCEECVSVWFDRERTCPMCRAQIADDPSWRDGSTSAFIHLC